MNVHESRPAHTFPPATSSGLIDFETADVVSPMSYPPRPTLVVTGKKPYPAMRVELVPLTYIRQPEYWGIEVVGTGPAGLFPMPLMAPVPYAVELRLDGVIGTAGIEVIGASHTEQIPLVTESTTQFLGAVEEARFRPMFPLWVEETYLRLTTASAKGDVEPEAGEIDLAPYNGSILLVTGHYQDGWIYSAAIVEQVQDSILSIIARQVFPDRTQ
jgi:hypothetical protein